MTLGQDAFDEIVISNSEPDLRSCVLAARQGNESAATELFHHLRPLVLRIVRKYLPRRMSEEDLVQAVFLRIFSKLAQFSGSVPLEHWVSRVAVNTCVNHLRRERVRPELRWSDLEESEQYKLESLASDSCDTNETDAFASRELVGQLLARLSTSDRLVMNLRYLEGKSIQDIEQITGLSASSVKVTAYRARLKMKKHLEELLAGTRDQCPV